MTSVSVSQLVDPDKLLFVDLEGSDSLAVVEVRYVPASDEAGSRRVAIEIAYDPQVPHPTAPYMCPIERLRRELVPPRRVLRIRPFRGA
jgi:hypothetical protein